MKKKAEQPKYLPEQEMTTTIPSPRWESTVPTPQPSPILKGKKRPRDRASMVSGR